ncbi:MAG: hypothetical protein A3G18_08915 [Rhodospirillales bacterium RIFCSPLOWO2_12_FULL_58_28]|nr:MAG: hypothetical protein A3H92_01510 [Rhodospirillales bacterium RIFCSPLOWO2_02_FULL_58_16]OHC78427.1 MAG: hypothetical protein A3G18_08915 [Rhodospirillales bacterium RIFCSPLOWO2_12_FULL_58_28]
MKKLAVSVFAALLTAVVFSPTATAGDTVKDAVMDYRLGYYRSAFMKMSRLAEKQNPEAMFWLGSMWHKGLGAPRDYVKAFSYYTEAALMGDAKAQNNLGLLYRDGLGVKRNRIAALAWFMVAADDHDAIAQANKDRLAHSMTPDQINRSRETAKEAKTGIEAAGHAAQLPNAPRQAIQNSPETPKQGFQLSSAAPR